MSSKGTNRKRKAMDPHPWRNKHCPSKKLGFPSEDEAQLYAKMAASSNLNLEAYACSSCPMWHVATGMRNGRVKVQLNKPKEG